jgi:hypothetical protein
VLVPAASAAAIARQTPRAFRCNSQKEMFSAVTKGC